MSHAGCETQSGDVGVFDVNVHTGYRPLCLQRPETPGLCHGEESVSTWPHKSGSGDIHMFCYQDGYLSVVLSMVF